MRAERFSAALCRGLIEAGAGSWARASPRDSFPRLYAAASLKRGNDGTQRRNAGRFSAALCRGLIEARSCTTTPRRGLYVFRGFMPRPH